MQLTEQEHFPPELLDCDAKNLHTLLSGPTLIHLHGESQPAIFVSVLLHGNETTGWDAIRNLLREYSHKALPRSISLFIGNISASREGLRHLHGQPDYNRVWPTVDNHGNSVEHTLVKNVFEIMRQRGVFLSIDIHNNTGLNPHYACINKLDNEFSFVARLFSSIVVYFTYPEGVQSNAFAQICPSVTIECGQVANLNGIDHAQAFLKTCLHLQRIPNDTDPDKEIVFYENFATVKVAADTRFCFDDDSNSTDDSVDLHFTQGLDQYNFTNIPAGTAIARVNVNRKRVVEVMTVQGEDVTQEYFAVNNGILENRKPIMPSMFSTDAEIVGSDCLCYLMRRL